MANGDCNPLPVFVKGSIEQSLQRVFGSIGGQAVIDFLKFDEINRRAIIRVPQHSYVKLRAALTLITKFQEIPCYFYVHNVSSILLALLDSN